MNDCLEKELDLNIVNLKLSFDPLFESLSKLAISKNQMQILKHYKDKRLLIDWINDFYDHNFTYLVYIEDWQLVAKKINIGLINDFCANDVSFIKNVKCGKIETALQAIDLRRLKNDIRLLNRDIRNVYSLIKSVKNANGVFKVPYNYSVEIEDTLIELLSTGVIKKLRLNQDKISLEFYKNLMQEIAKNNSIENLFMTGKKLENEQLIQLKDALKDNVSLVYLKVRKEIEMHNVSVEKSNLKLFLKRNKEIKSSLTLFSKVNIYNKFPSQKKFLTLQDLCIDFIINKEILADNIVSQDLLTVIKNPIEFFRIGRLPAVNQVEVEEVVHSNKRTKLF